MPSTRVIEDDIAVSPSLLHSIAYMRCNSCNYIGTSQENWMREDQSCPNCGSSSSPTSFMSNMYFINNFQQIQAAYSNRNQMPEVVKVISAFIIESYINEAVKIAHIKAGKALESDFIKDANLIRKCNRLAILANLVTESVVRAAIEDNHLLIYLRNSTDETLEDFREITESWNVLRQCRNDIAHAGLIQTGHNITAEEAFWVVVKFPSVLRWVLNQI